MWVNEGFTVIAEKDLTAPVPKVFRYQKHNPW